MREQENTLSFSCNLVCNFQGEHPEFSLDFTKEVVGHCPLCASDVVETPKTYECSNDKCKAVLFKKTKYFGQEMNVTLTKAKKLFGKEPASFTLKTKEGESYTASMKLSASNTRERNISIWRKQNNHLRRV